MNSCKRNIRNELKEGIIEYSVAYDDIDSLKFDSDIRPDRMVVKFSENNTVNSVEALSGVFSFAFIQDIDYNNSITLVKIFNKKLFYQEPMQENDCHFAYRSMPNISIETLDDTEEFLGFHCKKVLATYTDTTLNPFEIWFTEDIVINNPNHYTPFEEINGVMLKFSVIMFEHKMDIVATSVRPTKVSKDEFKIPLEYERVDLESMMELIHLFK